MNTYLKIITLLILIISLSTYAQKPEIKFEHLSRKNGLSQSTVYTILQDSKGFMWFGTQDGLNKYDGYTFTHYRHDPQNPDSLSNSFILSIYEDRTGTLWIGTDGGGLDKYDRHQDKFVHYQNDPQNPDSLSSDVVLGIYEDSAGILWFSTYDGGLNKFDRQQDKFVHYRHDPQNPHSLSSDAVWPIYEDSTGTLWVGADSDGLNKFVREQNQFVRYRHDPQNPDSLSSDKITAIYEDKTGKLWIGTDGGGINLFDREQNQFVRYQNDSQNPNSLSNDTVWSIYEESTGGLWIGTDGGLNQFDREQNQFMHYLHDPQNPNSLSSNYVMKIDQDRAGALWIGTDGGSLNKFDPQQDKFVHYFHDPQNPNTLSHNTVSSIYQDSTGALWVGTLGGGLNQFDHNRAQVTHYRNDPQNPDSLSHDEVWSIYEDRTGTLWIGTFGGGLNKFDRLQNQFVHYLPEPQNPDSLSNDKVSAIYEDKTGTLWIGTREGLNQFDREQNKFVHYRFDPQNPDSLSEDSILSIYEDRRGILWIGTQGGGLNKFDRQTGKFVPYFHNPQNSDSISHNEVSAIYEDKTGALWIATLGGGLNQFDPKNETFVHYREQDGLANDVVYGILEDNKGYLWLSTNKGLSKFNPKTKTFRNYDVLDGLQSNEFRAAYYKSQRGELYFGGINGFNGFDPERVKDNPYIPPIVITDFKIFNKPVTIGEGSPLQQHISVTHEITLSYKQSFFSFEFAALNFLQPTKNKYKYQLEGLDKDWNEIGTRRNAYYTSVPHGTYVFRVKGSNNDGVWNEQGTAIKIIVLPPPWKTWWAYTLYLITILAIILNYVRVQRQRLREKQQELEREKEIALQLREADRLKDEFLANTSHELRTPLNGIIGIVESLIEGAAGPITPQIHANLSMVAGSGRRLNHLVNDILDFSKLKQKHIDLQIKSVDMHTIAEVVLTLTQPLLGHKKVQLINAIPSGLPPINADENRVQQILCNLVGNAIKFTDSGTIEISAKVKIPPNTPKLKGGEVPFEKEREVSPCKKWGLGGGSANWLAITISDTGIGIPAKKLHRIFEAFEQADGSTSRIYGGTGLGLAVTQQLVQLHGGELCVQSQLGVGSQFTFALPLSSQSSMSSVQLPSQSSMSSVQLPSQSSMSSVQLPEPEELTTSQSSVAGSKLPEQEPLITDNGSLITEKEFTVLVVDDEPVNRQVLVNYLSLQNYTIHQAASGLEALAFLEKGQKPDIILLDVMMPQKSGYEVTRTIRETWSADELPIILLTAKNQVADLVTGLESGANDYLTKPVSKDELLARIKTHLHILRLKVESLRLAIENKNRLTQFLESVPVGIVIFEVKGTFFYLNQKVPQILGTEPSEPLSTIEQFILAYPFYIAGTEQPYPTAKLPFVQALDGETSTINNVEIHQADKIIPLEICGTPIFNEEGKMAYVINTLQDITERKTAMEAQENLKLTKELFQLNQA
ncbi:MAG: hypothetical protein DRR19_24975, partial [Candidatus Parabeggiatoa sp. nov. 1]